MGMRRARVSLSRLSILASVALAFFWTASPSQAKSSSIVLDAETGAVLEQSNADAQNYPASLTKMMTLYLTFEALDAGKLKLDREFPVSAHAAAQAPSKLGLMPGETITVRDCVLGVVTKSANDCAVVLAEGLGGNEGAFAQRMTDKARQLGMKNTFFHNASGLPDPQQHTTARDLATLARALYRDFPNHYHYFATREFEWRGAVFANHNHLMSSFQGMDGIKTGYIRASGFNLAASAVRNNRRLIAVVMGGESARARDLHMAQLLNTAFAEHRTIAVADSEPVSDDASPPAPRTRSIAAALSPIGQAEAAPTAPARRTVGAGRWAIQLGAFNKEAAAAKAAATVAKLPLAKGKRTEVLEPGDADKEPLYRARLTNFSKHEAELACRTLHKRHHQCAVIPPNSLKVASR
jgi:D-alanyl-D-alanine carboxypeptidase